MNFSQNAKEPVVRLLARPDISQGDVDGRIIFDGFATAKNFGDWILNFSRLSRQVKMKPKKISRIRLKGLNLQPPEFSTAGAGKAKVPAFRGFGLNVTSTKLGHLAFSAEARNHVINGPTGAG